MAWIYEIHGSNNRLVEVRRQFATKKEAETAARGAKLIMDTFDVPENDLRIVTKVEATE